MGSIGHVKGCWCLTCRAPIRKAEANQRIDDLLAPSKGPVAPDPLANVDWKAASQRWEQIAMEQAERAEKALTDWAQALGQAWRWEARVKLLEGKLAEIRKAVGP